MKSKTIVKKAITAALIFALVFVIAFLQVLYRFDRIFSDPLYQTGSDPSSRIKIIAIDEKTIEKYGNVSEWSREIHAQLVRTLGSSESGGPDVIVFDIMFVSPKESAGDDAFAEACAEAGNVITAVNVVQRQEISLENGALSVDNDHVAMVEYPYEALKNSSEYGFANTYMDSDGFIRYSRTDLEYGEEKIESLSMKAYKAYAEANGIAPALPKTENGFFAFSYTAKGGDGFEVLSLCDVLDGTVPASAFRDSAVFVGAYAPGMQDDYGASINKGETMYGVEIHANIFKSLLEQRTAIPVNRTVYALAVAALAAVFFLLISEMGILPATVTALIFAVADVAAAKLLYGAGIETPLVYPILSVILIYAAKLILGYLLETLKRRRVIGAFKKYVAPEVVDELAKKGDFSIKLGGEKRHIAVLFVDIRGFTPMSEGLSPEEVVEILNEYLSLTTKAIFKNKGTLDKFIGDATMAIFNAPFDLDDYVFRAVMTAMDIAKGSDELEKRLMERFGRSISFGIGVNCGEAVVGNIGCEHRMDFTAIGDTVNTAARLESNAARGQILISREVYERVKDRIEAEEIGVIPLKGKSQEVFVYQLNKIKTLEEN
ncbi:MAG: CHASE2 domain-containing protein [Clostridia bacterium]|nr:CHASE2 domain-containing protein [Clostridia bacterium]